MTATARANSARSSGDRPHEAGACAYISTRDTLGVAPLSFEEVLLRGLAPDGGLYLPQSWPQITPDMLRSWRALSYGELAARVLTPFLGGRSDLAMLAQDVYRGFGHPAVAPLSHLGGDFWMLELFHGPTLAFKDFALQLLGRLFDRVLEERGQRATIVGATSGDTGSAAIEAFHGLPAADVFILYPHGRVSEVQRRQMTTVTARNVQTLAIDGTFDDCQDLVKAMFADHTFRDRTRLSAVNSINWARIAAQIVYYVWAALRLGAPERPVSFAVPTGNFGNVFAAHAARRMGLPIDHLVIGTNRNDILARFFQTAAMTLAPVEPSLSPSMDIQISSNFERVLFEALDHDSAQVARVLSDFRRHGTVTVAPQAFERLGRWFQSVRVDDEATLATIARIHDETGALIDPHSAVAVAAGEHALASGRAARGVPLVALACAHPAKFPDAVQKATGRTPVLPKRLADLMTLPERILRVPNDLATVQEIILRRTGGAAGAQPLS